MKKRGIFTIIFIIAFALVLILVNRFEKAELEMTQGKIYATARVVEIIKDNMTEAGVRIGNQQVVLEVLSGELKGEKIKASSSSGFLYGADCTKGMVVNAVISTSGEELVANVAGIHRAPALYIIIFFFLFSLWLIGGKKGVMSFIGLAFTFVVIMWLYLPMIYRGVSPFLSAVVCSAVITLVSFYLIGGICKKTLISIAATVVGVILAGVFAWLFGVIAEVSGYNVGEIDELMYIASLTDIKVGGLLFSGILIASLGAVMDVSMSIASAVEEIHFKNPSLSKKELFKSGMKVGRDAMGTMSNTLILAFTGTSVNTLITLYAYNYPYLYTINLYSIAIEVIQGVAGSLAIIYTVPVVAFLSAVLYKRS